MAPANWPTADINFFEKYEFEITVVNVPLNCEIPRYGMFPHAIHELCPDHSYCNTAEYYRANYGGMKTAIRATITYLHVGGAISEMA